MFDATACDQGLHSHAKFHLNVFIVSASGGQNHNFGQILTFLGAPVPTPFTDEGQICCAKADTRYTLTDQISSECIHCVGFRWPKNTTLGNFRHFGGFCTHRLFADEGQIWCAREDPRFTLTGQISSACVYCVGLRWLKTTIFGKF